MLQIAKTFHNRRGDTASAVPTADRVNEPMLGMKTYTQDYIDACRARVDADLRAYRKQVGKAPSKEFEVRFFNDQVLLLDQSGDQSFTRQWN